VIAATMRLARTLWLPALLAAALSWPASAAVPGLAAAAAGPPSVAAPGSAMSPAPAGAAPAAPAGAATAPGALPPEQPSLRDDRDVIDASEKWLKLVDTGKFGAAWDVGAKSLQASVTREAWIKGIGEARRPLGTIKTRSRERFARAHSIPGAPDGDYAIVEFHANFANGKRAVEQLTWMLEPNGGIWRVAGYYIR
jgi:hypothetical protein